MIQIQNKAIHSHAPTFIIAEAGVNHGGDMEVAKQLVDVAVEADADAVKFQAFRTEHLILKDVEKAPYQQKTTDQTESQFDMLKSLEISLQQTATLKAYCEKKGIIFLTTPFDEQSLQELDSLDLAAYKIASTDTTNLPFLKKVAARQKPILLSTGMTFLAEITQVLNTLLPLNDQIILLQCTANYPIDDREANLNVLHTFKQHFDVLLGYSDHSVGIGASPYAVAMGAKVIEKHFTLDKTLKGPDHNASLSPEELKAFVKAIRQVEVYLGSDIKKPTLSELKTRTTLQKALVASRAIKQGELFTADNLVAKRTGGAGISPLYFDDLVHRKAHKDFKKDEIIDLP
ncbi:MAG: N-acetylneuraminate synthase [Bacteroidota bacterium]